MQILITGGAQGIGKAIALAAAKAGHSLILADLNAEKLDATASELRSYGVEVFTHVGDLLDPEVRAKLFTSYPQIDVLVNNAGIANPFAEIEQIPEPEFDRVMNVNLKLPFLLMQKYVPMMKKRGQGWIINIASSANIEGYPRQSVYAASKAGISSLSDTVAKETANTHIKVITILPSRTNTEMNSQLRGAAAVEGAQPPEQVGEIVVDVIDGKIHTTSGDDVRIKEGQYLVEHRIGEKEFPRQRIAIDNIYS